MTYKPLKRFREQSGILSKTVSYTMKQVTELKNSLGEPAIITFTDHVPRSQDEKLKVNISHHQKCGYKFLVLVSLSLSSFHL